MLAKIELKLKCEEELSYQMSSLFHGALMELLPGEYAETMHLSQLHPYAQHLEFRQDNWFWIVCCLNKDAAQVIIHDTLWGVESIEINKKNLKIKIIQKKYEELSYKELMDHFYEKDNGRYIQIHFASPTAFKQNGKYVFYPNLRCVFQSLMKKYDSACDEENMFDEETLELLSDEAQVVRYDLKSVSFSLEGIKIPSFIGKVTIKINGTYTLANFAKMLFEFGEYSGIGIKTALGMGYVKIIKERGKND